MKLKKILIVSFSIILFILIFLFAGLYFLFKSSLPEREGDITIKGIESQITIYFDEKGIPQIWAENEKDAWYAVGWLHASDRLFQMDLTRRVSYGRLSEFFGDLTLTFDRKQRLIGHNVIAENDMSNLSDQTKQLLAAYASGINQWVNHTTALPFEFQLLKAGFEPWTIKDCLTIFSFQTWFIDELQNNEDFFLTLESETDNKSALELLPPYPETAPKTVPQHEKEQDKIDELPLYAGNLEYKEFLVESLFPQGEMPFLLTRSSNAWAISGGKSKSGNALFCSDPHLELIRLPQFWYVVGVHTKDKSLEALGITSPGIPLVAMGHNGNISWAFTAAGTDVTDEYIEELNPNNPNEYRIENGYKQFKKRLELIKVSGSEDIDSLNIKISRHGPVIHENDTTNQVISLRWAGYDFSPSEGLESGFQLLKSNNFFGFRKSVTRFGALDANWMYADSQGNIGYQLGTPIPIRKNGTGRSRMKGWDGKSEWSGYYTLNKTPYAYNPSRGWLATCNNQPDDVNLEFLLQGNFADDRIKRIGELLSGMGKLSSDNMKAFQNDYKSTGLLPWVNEAINVLHKTENYEWAEKLEEWGGSAYPTSKEVALLETWIVLMKIKIFADNFASLTTKFLNKLLYRERNFYKIYMENNSVWFDDIRTKDKVETRDDIAIESMTEAIDIVGDRSWGEMNTLTMTHPLAAVPILSTFLSLERGPFPRAGTSGSLNNSITFWDNRDSFKTLAGPSWRFILDFEEVDGAQMVIPAGQSGHPLSPHFFDFYDLWDKGEYWTVPFTRQRVEERAVSILNFIPEDQD